MRVRDVQPASSRRARYPGLGTWLPPHACHRPRLAVWAEAAARLHELLPDGTVVRLVRDIEARDRYGRLLAYVYRDTDGLFVDLAMVRDGFAGTLAIAPNLAHRTELETAAGAAERDDLGLWHACGGNHVAGGR